VAERRARAALELKQRAKKGQISSPIVIEGRTIASSFWGKAWCDNLERYSDFSNRLPRGRTYLRNGSVVDLQISAGNVTASVSGSQLYDVQVRIATLPKARWTAVCKDCDGAIDSLVELLQGRFSKGVMTRICERDKGLFPSPKEIDFECSCPDYAFMCKHIAAVLYGVGARLDTNPELLFALRSVDHLELIAQAGKNVATANTEAPGKILVADELSEMFGIELVEPETSAAPAKTAKRPRKQAAARPAVRTRVARPAPSAKGRKKRSAAQRKALTAKMKARWEALAGSGRRSSD
jgi:uncharacterized Zn finger protein